MEQSKNSFDKASLKKIGKGALIAGGGALIVYLLECLQGMDFGQATPVIVALAAIIINSVKEWRAGK